MSDVNPYAVMAIAKESVNAHREFEESMNRVRDAFRASVESLLAFAELVNSLPPLGIRPGCTNEELNHALFGRRP